MFTDVLQAPRTDLGTKQVLDKHLLSKWVGQVIKSFSCYTPALHWLSLKAEELIQGRETSKTSVCIAFLEADQECHTNNADRTLPSGEVSTKPTMAGAARPALLGEDFKLRPVEKVELTYEGDTTEETTKSNGSGHESDEKGGRGPACAGPREVTRILDQGHKGRAPD